MARRTNPSRRYARPSAIAIPNARRSLTWPELAKRTVRVELHPVSDRRRFHPLRQFRPAVTVSGRRVSPLVVRERVALAVARPAAVGRPRQVQAKRAALALRRAVPHKVQFAVPERTIICVRRRRRKEVLHALRRVGRGSGGGRKRRNWFSEVTC